MINEKIKEAQETKEEIEERLDVLEPKTRIELLIKMMLSYGN